MPHDHRCSYCDHPHAVSASEILTAWAFIECEACGKHSLIQGNDTTRTNVKIAAKAVTSPIPKPPAFLTQAQDMRHQAAHHRAADRVPPVIGNAKKTLPPPLKPERAALPSAALKKPASSPRKAAAASVLAQMAKRARAVPNKTTLAPLFGIAKRLVTRAVANAKNLKRLKSLGSSPLAKHEPLASRARNLFYTKLNRGPVYAGVLLIAFGLSLLSAHRLRQQAERLTAESPADPPPVSRSVEVPTTNAPATLAPSAPLHSSAVESPPASSGAPSPAAAAMITAQTAPVAMTVIASDAVHLSAAAPVNPSSTLSSTLIVESTATSVLLRAGPGTNYRKLGVANEGGRWTVLDWRGDWFRVSADDGSIAWIRNDLVKRVATR